MEETTQDRKTIPAQLLAELRESLDRLEEDRQAKKLAAAACDHAVNNPDCTHYT